MPTLRDWAEDQPMDAYQALTLKVLNRTRDEEDAWSSRLSAFFQPELEGINATLTDTNRAVFMNALHLVRENRAAVHVVIQDPSHIALFEAQLLALSHNTASAQPSHDRIRTFKLDVIRGKYNVPSSTNSGVRILLRSQIIESIPELAPYVEGQENNYCVTLVLPRGGYDAANISQGSVSLFLDHERTPNPVGEPLEVHFIRSLTIPADSFVAAHGLTRGKERADFFQNPRFYPNGEKNPYQDPSLLAKMAELGVTFDHNIFQNPWLDDRNTFGEYDR